MDIKEKFHDWGHPSFLVDWLLDSEFHVILCQQGIHNQMFGIWRPQDCVEELKRLKYHPGFPSGVHLCDPVFNGDKFDYLSTASQYCNPSFKIPLNMGSMFLDKALERAKIFQENFKNTPHLSKLPNCFSTFILFQSSISLSTSCKSK